MAEGFVSVAAMFQFLRTELAVGQTFAEIAERSRNPEKRNRNRDNAQAAYDAVIRFLPRATLDGAELDDVKRRLSHLKAAIDQIQ